VLRTTIGSPAHIAKPAAGESGVVERDIHDESTLPHFGFGAVKLAGVPGTSTRRYSPRRSRDERREQLLDAALRRVDVGGFDGFSIEAVAREADLTKSVLYATFGTREELLRALVDRELERAFRDIAAAIPKPPHTDPGEVLRQALVNILRAVQDHPETWRLFVLPVDGMPLVARANVARHRHRLLERVEPLIAWGLLRLAADEVDPEIMTQVTIACFEQAIRMALTDPDRFTPERLVRFADAFIATHSPGLHEHA
jgi:AcrR family transcriptional regulator